MSLTDVGEAEVENPLQCRTFGRADEVPASFLGGVLEVGIGRTHIEITHDDELVRFIEFESKFCP